jgi:hypothetical protein
MDGIPGSFFNPAGYYPSCSGNGCDAWIELDFGSPRVITEFAFESGTEIGDSHIANRVALELASGPSLGTSIGTFSTDAQAGGRQTFDVSAPDPVQRVRVHAWTAGWQPNIVEVAFMFAPDCGALPSASECQPARVPAEGNPDF